ncbi:hypothetical protein BU23DRAFT_91588 [Bimuria novae-zelandiae CBS 107.79]|uniref:Uncharacterized protein n=1 Tax=Bimuria novae-zelandiae CBS 107.79 TaxID=1447943 RepID=A0A6A5VEN1_9PLEO|nr:hypothetical protein BU23DRAFT_91588 [Bimuria novae-zelandiae CBS 107.79]
MARMLGRSRSLRMLRGGHRETHQREEGIAAPQPALAAVEIERLKAATPVTRAENRVEIPEPDMLQRPRTSSGPGDRSTLFHKKVIPVQHLDDSCVDVSYVNPSKSTTTLYTAQLSEGEGIIGIALGSPTMPPQHWNAPHSTDFVTQNQGTITQISSNNQYPEPSRPVKGVQEEAPKPKLSRWKSLFKKTAPPPRQNKDNFYQLAKAVNSARVDSYQDTDSIYSRSFMQEDDASTRPSPTYTFKSDIRPSRNKQGTARTTDTRPRALTAGSPASNKVKSPLSRFALSPRPQMPIQSSTQPPSVTISGTSQHTSHRNFGDKPLLDVDIPQVQMERYSVMFSGLLQPQATSTSSLLQRRQGNTDRVKPLGGLPVKNDSHSRDSLHRRATSPNPPSKSPSGQLSLFPSPNISRALSPKVITNRPRPLQRSKTAPAVSPSQATFPIYSTKKDAIAQETDYPDTPSLSQASSPASTSDRSFDSTTEEITIVATPNAPPKPWRPQVHDEEPIWEIIQRQPSTVTKASALRSHPTSATSPGPQEPAPRPTLALHNPSLTRTRSQTVLTTASRRQGTARLETGTQATVGVARSVSVSRATRSPDKFLSPGPGKGEGGLSPGRIVEAGALTPTLVELKNRRSQRVQLVDA